MCRLYRPSRPAMFPVVMFFFGPYSDLCSVSGSGRSNRPCTATDLPRVESPMVPSCHGVNQASHLLSHVATTAKPTGDPASRSRRWIIYILMMLLDLDTMPYCAIRLSLQRVKIFKVACGHARSVLVASNDELLLTTPSL